MGDVNDGCLHLLVQTFDFHPHGRAELRIKVGQWLVEQEHLRVADDRPPHCNPLALTAAQLRRTALQQFAQAENISRFPDPLFGLRLGELRRPQAKCDVPGNRHMRVKCVVLEHHRDVAIFRLHVVDDAVSDADFPATCIFQTSDHPQRGRLSAPGRADQHHEFIVRDLQIEIGDHRMRAKPFDHFAQGNRRHALPLFLASIRSASPGDQRRDRFLPQLVRAHP